MIECPSCGREHRPGTLFCSNCGVYLPTGGPLGTKPILDIKKPLAEPSSASPEARTDDLYIKVVATGRQIPLPPTGGVLIGRLDAAQGVFPDFDLTSNGGRRAGVSREHCEIYRQGEGYRIKDLGSANGSLLNGNRLEPYMPHPIKAGDQLQLGKLKLRILTRDQIENGA